MCASRFIGTRSPQSPSYSSLSGDHFVECMKLFRHDRTSFFKVNTAINNTDLAFSCTVVAPVNPHWMFSGHIKDCWKSGASIDQDAGQKFFFSFFSLKLPFDVLPRAQRYAYSVHCFTLCKLLCSGNHHFCETLGFFIASIWRTTSIYRLLLHFNFFLPPELTKVVHNIWSQCVRKHKDEQKEVGARETWKGFDQTTNVCLSKLEPRRLRILGWTYNRKHDMHISKLCKNCTKWREISENVFDHFQLPKNICIRFHIVPIQSNIVMHTPQEMEALKQ